MTSSSWSLLRINRQTRAAAESILVIHQMCNCTILRIQIFSTSRWKTRRSTTTKLYSLRSVNLISPIAELSKWVVLKAPTCNPHVSESVKTKPPSRSYLIVRRTSNPTPFTRYLLLITALVLNKCKCSAEGTTHWSLLRVPSQAMTSSWITNASSKSNKSTHQPDLSVVEDSISRMSSSTYSSVAPMSHLTKTLPLSSFAVRAAAWTAVCQACRSARSLTTCLSPSLNQVVRRAITLPAKILWWSVRKISRKQSRSTVQRVVWAST